MTLSRSEAQGLCFVWGRCPRRLWRLPRDIYAFKETRCRVICWGPRAVRHGRTRLLKRRVRLGRAGLVKGGFGQAACLKAEGAIHAGGEIEIMGGDEGGEASVADEAHQRVEDGVGGLGIEIAGGFIGEEHAGGVGQCAAEGDALLFAAGESCGAMVGPVGEANFVEKCCGAGGCGSGVRAVGALREGDILLR